MKNNLSTSEIYQSQEEKPTKDAIDTINKLYINNLIKPYRESEKIIDMHTHTNRSDGEKSPMELVRHAIKNNISILGITDHDTIEGIKEINKNISIIIDSGITIIDGIELSAKVPKGRMHILGYNIDKENVILNNKTNQLKTISINTLLSLIEILKKEYNIIFSYDDIKQLINSNHNLGRPDLARLLIKNGFVTSVDEAFKKYLNHAHDKLGKNKKGIPKEECLELITNSGGIPVLAHPKTLKLSEKELLILIKEMINYGLRGIEVYHSTHTTEEVNLYLDIANKYDLLISGGSDYHGPLTKPDIEIGTGRNNNLNIKSLSLVNYLRKK